MSHKLTYLLVHHRGNRYCVLCPETYGMDTWGSNVQEDLIKKRKHWYTTYWREGNYNLDIPDYKEETRLNVVFTATRKHDIIAYLVGAKARMIDIAQADIDIDQANRDWNTFGGFTRNEVQR